MQQPKGIAVVLGVLLGLVVVGVVVGGILLIKSESKTQAPVANANAALQLGCSSDADCVSYCGGDPDYQPTCGVTSTGAAGSCTCRSKNGLTATGGNTNATTNTNATVNGNANVNASTNVNTNTSATTTGWKTYVNTGEGFSFQYPPDYWVEKNGSEGNETFWVSLTSPQTVSIKAGTGGAQSDAISFQPHMTATDLAEIFGSPSPIQDTLSFYQSLGLPTNERTVTLGGRAGFQVDVSELNTIRYTFTKNAAGDYFVISQIQVETTNGEVNATQYYETILSTFTFTK